MHFVCQLSCIWSRLTLIAFVDVIFNLTLVSEQEIISLGSISTASIDSIAFIIVVC